MKPFCPQRCAYINCRTFEVVYPSDSVFYFDGKYWYCCENCLNKGKSYKDSLKKLAITTKIKEMNKTRQALGL